tara:strand:- start:182 stop:478 length:297 start_codon:yes stop_codon:yes gene_type:complete
MIDLKAFVSNNLDNLVKISIPERTDKGFGALFIVYNEDTEKIDCRYIELGNEFFQPELRLTFKKFEEENPNSVIYFVLCNKDTCEILQIDLDNRNKNN